MPKSKWYRVAAVVAVATTSVTAFTAVSDVANGAPAKTVRTNAGGPTIETRSKPLITKGKKAFKDLNENGRLDKYEDWRLSPEVRAADLTSRMNLSEKAGLLHIGSERRGAAPVTPIAEPFPATVSNVVDKNLRALIIRDNATATELATRANAYQETAKSTPLGIPIFFAPTPATTSTPPSSSGSARRPGSSRCGREPSASPRPGIQRSPVSSPRLTARSGGRPASRRSTATRSRRRPSRAGVGSRAPSARART